MHTLTEQKFKHWIKPGSQTFVGMLKVFTKGNFESLSLYNSINHKILTTARKKCEFVSMLLGIVMYYTYRITTVLVILIG